MGKLQDVNTTDIADAIRLACGTMCRVLNADDDNVPFFGSQVYPDVFLENASGLGDSHVPGRHLNALLNAEDAIGVVLDEECVESHARAAFMSYSGPLAVPLSRERVDGKAKPGGRMGDFAAHHIREGFHALAALVKYRASEQARDVAEASVAAILKYWDPLRGWHRKRIKDDTGLDVGSSEGEFTGDSGFISGIARSMGPLVKYFRATGYGPALELAVRLKEKALDGFYPEDGSYHLDKLGSHTHSTTCVMSSLAQLADVTMDLGLLNRVKAFYDNGLWEIRDAIGWVLEIDREGYSPDHGEINNSGDILETALILGRWGHTECYADAERIVRGHILPSQLRDIAFIEERPNPVGEDGRRDIARRHRGAFGFPAPYGHKPLESESISFNMDIVGGGVGSLCEAVRESTRFDEAGHWVNLLFDHETPYVNVESPYTHPALTIRIKRPGALWIRVPTGVDPADVRIFGAEGAEVDACATNGYLLLSRPPVNRPLTVQFTLPDSTITLKHRSRDIRAHLTGDAVVAMENFGADLTFFDPID